MILSQDLYGQLASLQAVADNGVETVNGKTMEWSQDSVMVSRPYDHPENKMVFLWSWLNLMVSLTDLETIVDKWSSDRK